MWEATAAPSAQPEGLPASHTSPSPPADGAEVAGNGESAPAHRACPSIWYPLCSAALAEFNAVQVDYLDEERAGHSAVAELRRAAPGA